MQVDEITKYSLGVVDVLQRLLPQLKQERTASFGRIDPQDH